jgi:hypothetical protein
MFGFVIEILVRFLPSSLLGLVTVLRSLLGDGEMNS